MLYSRIFDDPIFSIFDRAFPAFGATFADHFSQSFSAAGPRFHAFDTGPEVIVRGELPGISDHDLSVSIENGVLTVRGQRTKRAPEGYVARVEERGAMKFSKSFTLPKGLDVDRIDAELKDGMLTLRIPKSPEAEPRQITVRSK